MNWGSFKWRNHQTDIGRFFNIDPLADKYVYNSPYAFSENRVIDGRELEGLEWTNDFDDKIEISLKLSEAEGLTVGVKVGAGSIEGNVKPGTTTVASAVEARKGFSLAAEGEKSKEGNSTKVTGKSDSPPYTKAGSTQAIKTNAASRKISNG